MTAEQTCLCHSEHLIHPRLVRAEIEAAIQVLYAGNATAFARAHGVHPEQLLAYLRGTREHLEPKLAKALGYERFITYRAISGDVP